MWIEIIWDSKTNRLFIRASPPSHGGDTGSKPVGTAKDFSGLQMTPPIFPLPSPPF